MESDDSNSDNKPATKQVSTTAIVLYAMLALIRQSCPVRLAVLPKQLILGDIATQHC
jgi:hypothetical protein